MYKLQQAKYKHDNKISCVKAIKAPVIARLHKHLQKKTFFAQCPCLMIPLHVLIFSSLLSTFFGDLSGKRDGKKGNSDDIEALVGQFGEKVRLSSSHSFCSPCPTVVEKVV